MSRTARASVSVVAYHVINRGNGRMNVFHKDADFRAFVDLMADALAKRPMRILAYCLMSNHFHLVLWPRGDGDLSRWMQWLLTAHVRRYHRMRGTSGHVWQGRFKAFPIQQDEHLLTVLRYVERNPLRAGLVRAAQNWRWSSLAAEDRRPAGLLHAGPVPRPADWTERINRAETAAEVEALQRCVKRGTPFGEAGWVQRTAKRLGLEASLRPRGRPRKSSAERERIECPLCFPPLFPVSVVPMAARSRSRR